MKSHGSQYAGASRSHTFSVRGLARAQAAQARFAAEATERGRQDAATGRTLRLNQAAAYYAAYYAERSRVQP